MYIGRKGENLGSEITVKETITRRAIGFSY